MTHEEMIEQLEIAILLIKQDGKDWWDERDIPILEEAIKAMKTKTCEDTISKEAVLHIFDDMTKEYAKTQDFDKASGIAWVSVQKLPSAQSEQRWIPVSERLPEKDGRYWVAVEFKHKDGSKDYQTNIATLELRTFFVLEDLFIGEQKRIVAWMPYTEPEPWKEDE